MMKKWSVWILLLLLVASAATFFLIDTNKESPSSPVPEEQPKEETPPPPPEEEPEEPEEDASLSEDIREAFSSVIESARNLFVRNDLRITAIGDSLTQGVGDGTDNGGYVGILEESINQNIETEAERVTIDNYGKRGNRTDQLLKRMEKEEIRSSIEQADLILITIGANDVMKVVKDNVAALDYQQFVEAQSGYEENLRSIFTKIRQWNPDAEVYMLGVYNPFEKYFNHIPELNQIMSDWNRISKQVMTEFDNISFIPIRDIFENTDEDLLWEDNFHPNEVGYKRIAERVLEYIRDDIEEQ